MKKIFGGLGIVLILIAGIVAVKTWQSTSRQLTVDPAAKIDIDIDVVSSHLARALQFPTISGGDLAPFDSLQTFLAQTFPEIHEQLEKQVIGEATLVYNWEGSNPDLDPLVITAHQDVVPIEPGTEQDWQHSPFSGKVIDGYIWGRGTLDNKNSVLASLEAVTILLAEGYQPERTVILAYGHDEEIGGLDGAQKIAAHLKEEEITPWFVVDEGGIVLEAHPMPVSSPLALIGIAEKGYLSLLLTVNAEGGHSSMPARETAIGILSSALHKLTSNPFPPRLEGISGQLFDFLGPEMSLPWRSIFANRWLFGPVIKSQLAKSPSSDALLRTSTAPTMLEGSPKDNVLPAQAQAVVNFRILPGETTESVTARVKRVIDDSRVVVEPVNQFGKNPSPVSSTESDAFLTLQTTIHEIYPDAVVAPYLVVGGTDARHYAGISPNVFIFMPTRFREGDMARLHGTNERILQEDYADAIRFFRQLILNTSQHVE